MNTHQKVFFAVAVSAGCMAMAFASSPSKTAVAEIELPRVTVIGHRVAPEITLERTLVIGHRDPSMIASRSTRNASNG